jgi:acyl carrier protein
VGGSGGLFASILKELASLPDISDAAARRAFLADLDCGSLAEEIDMSGSAIAFFRRLLVVLGESDQAALPDFMRRVALSQSIGVDRKQVFLELRDAVLALDPAARAALFASDNRLARLPAEFRAATQQGITGLGSKYIPDLYFRREEIEDRFDEFLRSSATCFLVVSKPGRGKTNFLCDIVRRLSDEQNILFLTARVSLASPYGLLEVVSSWLGYGADWSACFADLTRLSQPCLILLDAINESAEPPEVLKEAIHTLLRETRRAGIKLVVTCRTDFWQFYRASFWGNFIWTSAGGGTEWTREFARGQDLPLFAPEQFDEVVSAYFRMFQVDGRLVGEAAERCRHPLMLRIFCEAYAARSVGTVTELRLYRLFREFWTRKIGQVTDVSNLRQSDAVARLVLTVAGLMRQRQSTSVPRDEVAKALATSSMELDSSSSLYSRVLDEEIILEENIDEEAGIRNVVFVYDRFSEYAIALNYYTTERWHGKSADEILLDTNELMRQERAFGTLRGSLEFLVQRLEDRRPADKVHFAVLNNMIKGDWKWVSIGSVLTFQLDPELSGPAFWEFVWELAGSDIGFVRRMVADHVALQVSRSPGQVLAVLNRLRADPVSSVRNAAVQAMFGLHGPVAVQQIEQLASATQDQALAAVLLLSPRDWTSLVLRRKLEWLVGAGRGMVPGQAIIGALQARTPDALGRLFNQEELASAMAELRKELNRKLPGSVEAREAAAWLDQIRKLRDRSRETLENDLTVLERTFVLAEKVLDLARRFGAVRRDMLAPLPDLIPDASAAMRFFGEFYRAAGIRQFFPPRNCYQMAAEASRNEPLPHPGAGLDVSASGYLGRYAEDGAIAMFREIASNVCARAARARREGHGPLGLNTPLSSGGLGLDRGELLTFLQEVLDEYGIAASPVDMRGLTSIGRIVLWLGDRLQQQQRQESKLLRLREEIKTLDVAQLRDRLATYQHPLSKEQQAELTSELLVLAGIYENRQAEVAELLGPLIIWHDSQDSETLAEVLDEIHNRATSAFWPLAQALLNHSDQRVIDLAGAAIERAERVEFQDPADAGILSGIAEIVEEIAGVPAEDIRMEARFVDDLDIDSLSAVEIAVAAQDKFGIEVPDEQLPNLTTVRIAVEYVKSQSVRQGVARQDGADAASRATSPVSAAIVTAEYAELQDPASARFLSGLAEIVEEIAGVPAERVRMEARFVDDLDIDSLSAVEIAVAVQDKFGIEVSDEQLPNLTTVRHAVEYLQRESVLPCSDFSASSTGA